MKPFLEAAKMSDIEVCTEISRRTEAMMTFWANSKGWAPVEASDLMSRSMLDWQTSLSKQLCRWIDSATSGELILAWANLGALVEGQLKLFLCVYYTDYQKDAEAICKKGDCIDPDGCMLEELRQFFQKRIWTPESDWSNWVLRIQHRRNTIHAFKQRELGTIQEWKDDLKKHLEFIDEIDSSLPYPDASGHDY